MVAPPHFLEGGTINYGRLPSISYHLHVAKVFFISKTRNSRVTFDQLTNRFHMHDDFIVSAINLERSLVDMVSRCRCFFKDTA